MISSSKLIPVATIVGLVLGWLIQPLFFGDTRSKDRSIGEQSTPTHLKPHTGKEQALVSTKLEGTATENTDSLAEIATLSEPRSFPALLKQLEASNSSYEKQEAIGLLFSRWAKVAPESAFAYLRDNYPPEYHRRSYFGSLINAWIPLDPDQALAKLDQLPESDLQRDHLMMLAAAKLAETDPKRALKLAQKHVAGDSSSYLARVVGLLAKESPEAALVAAFQSPYGHVRSQALSHTFKTLGMVAPERALSWMEDPGTAPGEIPAGALASGWNWNEFMIGWGKSDPKAAAAYLVSERASDEAIDSGAYSMAQAWANRDASGLIEWVNNLDATLTAKHRIKFRDSVAEAVYRKEPAFTIERAIETKSARMAKSGFEGLAAEDFDAAMQALRMLDDESVRHGAGAALFEYLRRQQPGSLAEHAEELLATQGKGSTSYQVFSNAKDLDSATLEALLQEDPISGASVLASGALKSIASEDPDQGRQLAEQIPVDSPSRDKALQALVQAWGHQAPDEAAEWLHSQPRTGKHSLKLSYQGLVDAWARHDTEAASRWLESLPATAERDAAAAQFVTISAATEPLASVHAAALIEGERQRVSSLKTALESYLVHDFAEARALIEEMPVSESLRQDLQLKVKERARWNAFQ